MSKQIEIAVIGGGASGFMAAITAAESNPKAKVTIFESGKKVLSKVLVTGGGRCNLTNTFQNIVDMKQAYPRGYNLMKRLFNVFDYEDCYQWFEDHGVPLVAQSDGCVYPAAQDAQVVVDCLVNNARFLEVSILCNHCMEGLEPLDDGSIRVHFKDRNPRKFDRVIVTTGGKMDFDSLLYLAHLGHIISMPKPSLYTFNIDDQALHELSGTTIDPVVVSLGRGKYRSQGSMLITHWGVSGPAILRLSSYAADYLMDTMLMTLLSVCWTGTRKQQEVEAELLSMQLLNPHKQVGTLSPFNLPSRLWHYLLQKVGLDVTKPWAELGRKTMNRLLEVLVNDTLQITGKGVSKDEFVVAGGVCLKSVDSHTLASLPCPNLYFAGELLDVDGITGGFNLQAAWTTGVVAGLNAAQDD